MTSLEHRGRTLFIAIVAVGTLTMLWGGLFTAQSTAPGRMLALYGRPLVIVLLGVLAAHGRRWAHRALVGFFVLVALVVVVGPLAGARPGGSALAVLLALGVVYVACIVLLVRSAAVRAFLRRPLPGVPAGQPAPPAQHSTEQPR